MTATKTKPKQTVAQRGKLGKAEYTIGRKLGYEQGYRAGHADALRAMPARAFDATTGLYGEMTDKEFKAEVERNGGSWREPEATIKHSWLARMWKWVRG